MDKLLQASVSSSKPKRIIITIILLLLIIVLLLIIIIIIIIPHLLGWLWGHCETTCALASIGDILIVCPNIRHAHSCPPFLLSFFSPFLPSWTLHLLPFLHPFFHSFLPFVLSEIIESFVLPEQNTLASSECYRSGSGVAWGGQSDVLESWGCAEGCVNLVFLVKWGRVGAQSSLPTTVIPVLGFLQFTGFGRSWTWWHMLLLDLVPRKWGGAVPG